MGVLGHTEARRHAAEGVDLAFGEPRSCVQPGDDLAQAVDQGIVETVGKADPDPMRRRLGQWAREADVLCRS